MNAGGTSQVQWFQCGSGSRDLITKIVNFEKVDKNSYFCQKMQYIFPKIPMKHKNPSALKREYPTL
jgi:hypothetical protein